MQAVKILNHLQIKEWDAYTIQSEPISSLDLMERASLTFVECLLEYYPNHSFEIWCGLGNNGGDGLAVARILVQRNYSVKLRILRYSENTSSDFEANYNRLPTDLETLEIYNQTEFPNIEKNTILIDAILGSGFTRKLDGLIQEAVLFLNQTKSEIVSIDIATGLFTNKSSKTNICIKPKLTISFQNPKLCFFFNENENFVGDWVITDISLSKEFIKKVDTNYFYLNKKFISSFIKKRSKFSHKGNFGKALLVVGSQGKMGAAVLSSKACIRTGIGLLTVHIPKIGNTILQVSVPEAMVILDQKKDFISKTKYNPLEINSIGIGPGIGTRKETLKHLEYIISNYLFPIVLDADAINLFSENRSLLKKIPSNSILTPHPKELERLIGKFPNEWKRMEAVQNFSQEFNLFIILKGHYTSIFTPEKKVYFNSTGNSGMATGGSGDVLTGILTSLLAQKYSPLETCLLGVYIHGLAGDLALKNQSIESLTPSDCINSLGEAFISLKN